MARKACVLFYFAVLLANLLGGWVTMSQSRQPNGKLAFDKPTYCCDPSGAKCMIDGAICIPVERNRTELEWRILDAFGTKSRITFERYEKVSDQCTRDDTTRRAKGVEDFINHVRRLREQYPLVSFFAWSILNILTLSRIGASVVGKQKYRNDKRASENAEQALAQQGVVIQPIRPSSLSKDSWSSDSEEPLSPRSQESARSSYRHFYSIDSEEDVDESIRKSCAGFKGWANSNIGRAVVFTITSAQFDVEGYVEIGMATLGGDRFEIRLGQEVANALEVRKKIKEIREIDCCACVNILSGGDLLQDIDPISPLHT